MGPMRTRRGGRSLRVEILIAEALHEMMLEQEKHNERHATDTTSRRGVSTSTDAGGESSARVGVARGGRRADRPL